MEFVVNKDNGEIYQLKETVRDTDPLSPTYQKDLMVLERLFDLHVKGGTQAGKRISTANPKYRPLTDEEKAKLAVVAPRLAPTGVIVRLSQLENIPTTAPNDDDAPMADADASATNFLEQQLQQMMPQVGDLVEPTERDTFDRIIVTAKVKEELNMGLNLILGRERLDQDWGLSEISPMKGRCIMNFVGPPGTGKTQSAKALARAVNKKLYKVDYSQVISKWVGDTGKHIKSAFAAAKQHGAVLFFDEADSLMSKRLSMPEDGVANSINQNRNILMQELDAFDGIVLMASNFFENYDEALLRRIAQHVHFELPDQAMREKIIDLHLPAATKARFDGVNIKELAKESKGLSGGDILVVCENAIKAAALGDSGKINQQHLLTAIENVKKNKIAHKTWKAQRRPMGLGAAVESLKEGD